jgi:magnesium chelatase subunit I
MELEYEGELQGAPRIARELISRAALETFEGRRRLPIDDQLDEIVDHFDRGGVVQLADMARDRALLEGLQGVPSLMDVVDGLAVDTGSEGARAAAGELVLEALVAERRISRSDAGRFTRGRRKSPPPGGPQFPGTLEI